ncbi:MAG: MBL fold metallo-hydrolase [Chloroflexi bacterium]|nr:MBL fold metallo-hydrolase [Chloroflexota bacterium]
MPDWSSFHPDLRTLYRYTAANDRAEVSPVPQPLAPTTLTFLGTGNFFAPNRDWNSFVVDRDVLVEPSPTVLPNLRRAGIDPAGIGVVFVSHFHADHTFGWPFLLVDALVRTRRTSELWVVGPPGVETRLNEMLRVGAVDGLVRRVRANPDTFPVHYLDVNERDQHAGPMPFRAVRVEHEPELECFGYLFQRGGRTIGYSGDSQLCDGLREIAAQSDLLVLECALHHDRDFPGHIGPRDVRTLRQEFPDLPFILSHVNDDTADHPIPGTRVANDLETIAL